MNSSKNICYFMTLLAVTVMLSTVPQTSEAASYKKLIKKGYKIGTLSQNRARTLGWRLSYGKKQYFCRSRVNLVYVGQTGLVNLLSYGQQMKINRKRYDTENGGRNMYLPQMRDFKAGRIKPHHVGRCSLVR